MTIELSTPPRPSDWARHTPTSDPGTFAALVEAVPPRAAEIGEVVRNLSAHYRAEAEGLPESSRGDIDLRRVEEMLRVDQERHPGLALDAPRDPAGRLQGCCRDHTLLAVSVLRQAGIPARSRVGFVDYFVPGWHHDHVVVELHDGEGWRRTDPELSSPADPLPFTTAAEAYRALRAGTLDPSRHGVAPGHAMSGAEFVLTEVFWEVAHRYGDETLLWDTWGAIPAPGEALDEPTLALLDEVTELLVRADTGDMAAERSLYELYLGEERLRPGAEVVRFSPVGDGPVRVALSPAVRG